jgi:hypothetical protein
MKTREVPARQHLQQRHYKEQSLQGEHVESEIGSRPAIIR